MTTTTVIAPPTVAALRFDPFTAVHYHFGQLLGVEDLEVEQASHRSRQELALAWLHRAGVVWGLEVTADRAREELHIAPGLAVDTLGRFIRVDAPLCVSVPEWFLEHHDEVGIAEPLPADVAFTAHVVLLHRACLDRPVPSLVDPCDGTSVGTALSRVVDTVEARLVAGPAPARDEPYHRLRLLFGLAEPALDGLGAVLPDEQLILDERAAVLALPADDRPMAWLAAFRRCATDDTIALAPPDGSRLPSIDPAPLTLAEISGITLVRGPAGWRFTDGEVDNTIRPNHVATSTVQELLCGPPSPGGTGGGGGLVGPAAARDAGGPRLDPTTMDVRPRTIVLSADKPLLGDTVVPDAFSVTVLTATGWNTLEVRAVHLSADGLTVTLNLRESVTGDMVRVIAKGTGATPLLGTDLVPLAGRRGGPPGTAHDGHDFVNMLDRRS